MIVITLALGLLIGLSLGALGGGGSILTVPALVFALGFTAQQATTGSLVIVGVTAGIASIGHSRAGNTRWVRGIVLALIGVPASLIGTWLNRAANPNVLLLSFAALMVIAGVGMLLRARPEQQNDPTPTRTSPPTARKMRTVMPIIAAGLGIGFLTGFLGVGGGFIIVPALVILLRFEMPEAVGTSLLVIALNSAVALAARAGHASFSWHVILPFTAAAVLGSVAGKRVAGRMNAATLTRAFAVLQFAVAAYVAIRAGLDLV
jgi:uncharacterized membrane protein YfcA